MPRKAFIADLQKAVGAVSSIAGISDVQTGNDDGEFTFMCLADGQKLKISVLIPGTSHIPATRYSGSRAGLPLYAPTTPPSSTIIQLTTPQNSPTIPQITCA